MIEVSQPPIIRKLPMTTIAQVSQAIQTTLTTIAEAADGALQS